ncbi:MAG: methyltransferase, partial [Eubacterium sp.]
MGLSFFVTPDVLIPRPDTEPIVEKIIEKIGPDLLSKTDKLRILDLCTGSGAIGLSLKKNIKDSEVTLSDISEAALKIAVKNAEKLNLEGLNFIKSDLFYGFKKGIQ